MLHVTFGMNVLGMGSNILCDNYKYNYFPMATYIYDSFQVVKFKYKYSLSNTNFMCSVFRVSEADSN